jgi:hypothetical protein
MNKASSVDKPSDRNDCCLFPYLISHFITSFRFFPKQALIDPNLFALDESVLATYSQIGSEHRSTAITMDEDRTALGRCLHWR